MGTIDTLERYFDGCFARREKFAMITDATPVRTLPDALWRKRLAAWLNEPAFREKNRLYCVGSANIVTWAPAAGVLTALQWLWKPPAPQYFCPSTPEAIAWCLERLDAERVPRSFRLDELRRKQPPRR